MRRRGQTGSDKSCNAKVAQRWPHFDSVLGRERARRCSVGENLWKSQVRYGDVCLVSLWVQSAPSPPDCIWPFAARFCISSSINSSSCINASWLSCSVCPLSAAFLRAMWHSKWIALYGCSSASKVLMPSRTAASEGPTRGSCSSCDVNSGALRCADEARNCAMALKKQACCGLARPCTKCDAGSSE